MKKTAQRITDALPPKSGSDKMVNVKCDEDTYRKLKDKLKKQKRTVKDFFMASIHVYLNEK